VPPAGGAATGRIVGRPIEVLTPEGPVPGQWGPGCGDPQPGPRRTPYRGSDSGPGAGGSDGF